MHPRTGFVVCAAVTAASVVVALMSQFRRDPPPAALPPPPRLIPPLEDAKVGEWMLRKAGNLAERLDVVAATDYDVTIKSTRYQNEQPSPPVIETFHRNSFGLPPDCVIRAIDPDRLEVGGKTYDCWRLDVYTKVRRIYFWVSNEIPVNGFLKEAAVGKAIDEVHAVTFAEGEFEPK